MKWISCCCGQLLPHIHTHINTHTHSDILKSHSCSVNVKTEQKKPTSDKYTSTTSRSTSSHLHRARANICHWFKPLIKTTDLHLSVFVWFEQLWGVCSVVQCEICSSEWDLVEAVRSERPFGTAEYFNFISGRFLLGLKPWIIFFFLWEVFALGAEVQSLAGDSCWAQRYVTHSHNGSAPLWGGGIDFKSAVGLLDKRSRFLNCSRGQQPIAHTEGTRMKFVWV